jgi:hypothetical protein
VIGYVELYVLEIEDICELEFEGAEELDDGILVLRERPDVVAIIDVVLLLPALIDGFTTVDCNGVVLMT